MLFDNLYLDILTIYYAFLDDFHICNVKDNLYPRKLRQFLRHNINSKQQQQHKNTYFLSLVVICLFHLLSLTPITCVRTYVYVICIWYGIILFDTGTWVICNYSFGNLKEMFELGQPNGQR